MQYTYIVNEGKVRQQIKKKILSRSCNRYSLTGSTAQDRPATTDYTPRNQQCQLHVPSVSACTFISYDVLLLVVELWEIVSVESYNAFFSSDKFSCRVVCPFILCGMNNHNNATYLQWGKVELNLVFSFFSSASVTYNIKPHYPTLQTNIGNNMCAYISAHVTC